MHGDAEDLVGDGFADGEIAFAVTQFGEGRLEVEGGGIIDGGGDTVFF